MFQQFLKQVIQTISKNIKLVIRSSSVAVTLSQPKLHPLSSASN